MNGYARLCVHIDKTRGKGIWEINSCNVRMVESSHPVPRTECESEVAQLCPTLCDPMDCSPQGSSVHGILQARILEWAAISFSRGSSRPRDRTQVSHIVGRHFYSLSYQGSRLELNRYLLFVQ